MTTPRKTAAQKAAEEKRPQPAIAAVAVEMTDGNGLLYTREADSLGGYTIVDGNILVLVDTKGRDIDVFSPMLWAKVTPTWALTADEIRDPADEVEAQ